MIPVALLVPLSAPAGAQSVEDFYKGKTITLSIGFDTGGGYDIYGRLLSRHMGKHIPGRPTIIVQNMPGAGSLRAAQHLFSLAPKDGTALGTFGRQMGIAPLLGTSAQYDGTKFNWIGSITNEVSTCVAWHTATVKTWADMLEKPITLGGDGPGADPDVFALLYRNVSMPRSSWSAAITAPRRSSSHGTRRGRRLCGYSWTIRTKHQPWLKEKKINILVQALRRRPDRRRSACSRHGENR